MVIDLDYNVLLTGEFERELYLQKQKHPKAAEEFDEQILEEANRFEPYFFTFDFDPKYHALVYIYHFFLKQGKDINELHHYMIMYIFERSTETQLHNMIYYYLNNYISFPKETKDLIQHNYRGLIASIRPYLSPVPVRILEHLPQIKKRRGRTSITDIIDDKGLELFYSYYYLGVGYELYSNWLKLVKETADRHKVCLYDKDDHTVTGKHIFKSIPIYYWLKPGKKTIKLTRKLKKQKIKKLFGKEYKRRNLKYKLIVGGSFITALKECENSRLNPQTQFFVCPLNVQYMHSPLGHLMGLVFHVKPPHYMYIFDSSPESGRITEIHKEFQDADEIFKKYDLRKFDFCIHSITGSSYPIQNLEDMTISKYINNDTYGFCVVFALMFLHYVIIYPNAPPEQIVKHMVRYNDPKRTLHDMIRQYAEVLLSHLSTLPEDVQSDLRPIIKMRLKDRCLIFIHRFDITDKKAQRVFIDHYKRFPIKNVISTVFSDEYIIKDIDHFNDPKKNIMFHKNLDKFFKYVLEYKYTEKNRDWNRCVMHLQLFKEFILDLLNTLIHTLDAYATRNGLPPDNNFVLYISHLRYVYQTHPFFNLKNHP